MELRYTGKARIDPRPPTAAPLSTPDPIRDREWVYLPEPDLVAAVNIALILEQPLLVTGEPGTGKTQLAYSIAAELKLGEVLRFDTKSNSVFRDLFYRFDALRSFRDAQNKVEGKTSLDYISYSALGKAILLAHPKAEFSRYVRGFDIGNEPKRSVVLIDEIDKAPRDFPNDLLHEVDRMKFDIPELETEIPAAHKFRPIVVITSNSERLLPAAFLRRCIYYHIPFPEKDKQDRMREIVAERLGQGFPSGPQLIRGAIEIFYLLRADSLNLRKRPSTAELLGWLVALRDLCGGVDASPQAKPDVLRASLSCLVKDAQDLHESIRVLQL
jgi:MoxR-like ATPase